jgi:hypothetical protein
MLAKMETNKERMKANQGKMMAKLDDHHERMTARMDAQLEKTEETESESTHQEVPKEEAAVETFGALKERYGDRHLAVERRRKPKKQTQGNGWSRKKLAAACRGMTRLHGVKDKARKRLYQNPRKGRSSGRDVGRNRNATTA